MQPSELTAPKLTNFMLPSATFSKFYAEKDFINIAGRLPENSRNRFVDRQSKKKTVKKTDQKNLFIEG